MVKLTTIPKPVAKCQKPKPKQTQQSPTISQPKNNSQIEQNEEQIEIPTTSDRIVFHDSHKMPKTPPQTQLESLSNTHTRGHQTKPQPSIHSSRTKQEIEKKTEIQTKGGPHTTKEKKVKEPIGGKKTESTKTIDKQHGLDTTQHSEWERQENIESPKDDPTMDHKFQKPNMSKPDYKIKRQGGLKDLTELEDMHNKSTLQKNLSQTAKNETGSPNSQHKNKHSPQKEVNLDGNTRQQGKHIGQPTNSYDRRKLNTNAFQENEHEKKMEVQKNTKIEPKGSTPIENSTSLELGETVLGMKKTDKNVKAHDNKAIENEQKLDKGKNYIQQVASEVEHELARRGILHAPKQCVYPSGPQLEAKTDTKSDAKTNRRQNTPNASGGGEIWRRLGHGDSVDSSQRVPQTQLNETTRLETGKQLLQQIESHISKEKKLDRRTDIGASIIQRATLQATMMDLEESTEEESEVLGYESPPRSPSPKFPVYQFPPMIADQRYTWPRKESLLTPKAYDERVGHNLLTIQNMSTTLDLMMSLCRLLHHIPSL